VLKLYKTHGCVKDRLCVFVQGCSVHCSSSLSTRMACTQRKACGCASLVRGASATRHTCELHKSSSGVQHDVLESRGMGWIFNGPVWPSKNSERFAGAFLTGKDPFSRAKSQFLHLEHSTIAVVQVFDSNSEIVQVATLDFQNHLSSLPAPVYSGFIILDFSLKQLESFDIRFLNQERIYL